MFPPDMDINKGVELVLKGDKKKPPKQTPKFFDIKLALFGREIRLSIDIKKKSYLEYLIYLQATKYTILK